MPTGTPRRLLVITGDHHHFGSGIVASRHGGTNDGFLWGRLRIPTQAQSQYWLGRWQNFDPDLPKDQMVLHVS
jgi:hypothetical protein